MAYADTLRSKTFTGPDIANLIEGIFSSSHAADWTTWTPTLGAAGSMTFTSTTIRYAEYMIIGKLCFIRLRAEGTIGGTLNSALTATLPFTSSTLSGGATHDVSCFVRSFGTNAEAGTGEIGSASTTLTVRRSPIANWAAGAGTMGGHFFYKVA
jgi:hypothetical protein